MKNKVFLCSALLLALSGCASVPTVDSSVSDQAKTFPAPKEGNTGIYIYREDTFVGGAGVELVDEEVGKAEVRKVAMAESGNCPSI
ncbi:hypothetical protein [Vibrio splendidus]|uniref:Lipoprotein n=1 Tax=Vibrio splendidus TaxID=29497 RepID=A0A7Y4G0L0_VIBSP|nr:hypothetical protein [Vibrio splendidus]NOJ14808.1 hypothetical protein [Vibrio splendidus]